MMTIVAVVQKPDDIAVKITATLSIGAWKKIKSDLEGSESYASNDLARELRAVIQNVEQTFYANDAQIAAVK